MYGLFFLFIYLHPVLDYRLKIHNSDFKFACLKCCLSLFIIANWILMKEKSVLRKLILCLGKQVNKLTSNANPPSPVPHIHGHTIQIPPPPTYVIKQYY